LNVVFQPFTDTFTVAKGALVPATGGLSRTFDEAGNRQIFSLSTWFKIGQTGEQEGSVGVALFGTKNGATNSESTWFAIRLNTSNQLVVSIWNDLITTRTFEETSQWYHLLVAVDTTQGTTANRIKVYIDGVQETSFGTTNYPSSSASLAWGLDSTAHYVGIYNDGSSAEWNGYLAQTAYITGSQLTPSSFGQTDTSTNRWIPKDISGLTFGSAGFFLDYADSWIVGDDESGNTNDFTNINSVSQVADTPTVNWATLDPNRAGSGISLSNGNRTLDDKSAAWRVVFGTIPMRSGKWYWECHITSSGSDGIIYGVTNPSTTTANSSSTNDNAYGYANYGTLYGATAYKNAGWTTTTFTNGDKIGVAVDMDNGYLYFAKNNTWLMSSDPTATTGTGSAFTIEQEPILYPYINQYDSFTTNMQFDSSLWSYSAPTGYSALSQDNLPSTDQFISAFSWIKNRDAVDNHMLFDRVRGATKDMHSNTEDIQATNVETLQSFLAGGVQVGNDVEVNTANESYVLWNWMFENTGSGASNEDGSINTIATLVDTTLGCSVGTFTGTGANATVGHGLGVVPGMIIVKSTDTASRSWAVYHSGNTAAPETERLILNTTTTTSDQALYWNDTAPTSTVFSLGSDANTNQSSKVISYICFAPSQFISLGSYEGNANADGAFVPTLNSLGIPIQPVWVLTKNIDAIASWTLLDTSRSPYNVANKYLAPDTTGADQTADVVDIDTGGLKWRNSNVLINAANTYIYMAIGTPIIDTDGRIIAGR